MAIQEIEFIRDNGTGETVVDTQTIATEEFSVKIDGQLYSPTITQEIEIENDGDTNTTTDQCGNTERERNTNNGWTVTVQGIVTANDSRRGNLSLQMLRDVVATMNTVSIRSDITGSALTEFEVSNTVITQANDLVSVHTADTDGDEQAFDFQLQLGESESDN